MTIGDRLVIEVPLQETNDSPNSLMFPKVVNNLDGTKSVQMSFALPDHVDTDRISVHVKDLILRVEEVKQDPV